MTVARSDVRKWGAALGWYLLLPGVMALLSITLTGFVYWKNNNVFHVPYVLQLFDHPEFKGDAFYATLPHFVSLVWPMVRIFSTEDNIPLVFEVANYLSRAAAFAGLIYLIRAGQGVTAAGVLICLIAVVLTPLMQSYSIVGGHGMFLEYFTHSETTWGLIFLGTTLLATRRLTAGAAVLGIVFALNAFIGIWMGVAAAIALLVSWRDLTVRGVLHMGAAFFTAASPVILWIALSVGSPTDGQPFRYIQYIREYFPDHFLIEAVPMKDLIKFGMLALVGVLAAFHLTATRFWVALQVGLLLVFLVGIPLPYLVDSRFIFNLHLLRAAGVEQAIAVVLALVAAVKLIQTDAPGGGRYYGVAGVSLLTFLQPTVVTLASVGLALLAPMLPGGPAIRRAKNYARIILTVGLGVLVASELWSWAIRPFIDYGTLTPLITALLLIVTVLLRGIRPQYRTAAVAAVLGGYLAFSVAPRMLDTRHSGQGRQTDGDAMVSWIIQSDVHGTVLLPIDDPLADVFQLSARRPIWVDKKQGAAVMWSPSFYTQWSTRMKEVAALHTPTEYYQYAKDHRIPNVLLASTAGECPAPATTLRSTGRYVLCRP